MQLDSESAIEFRAASYHLPNGREVLHQLTLTVTSGEILVLLGRSGSGKTTTLKLVNRLVETTGGDILVEGRSNRSWNVIELRRHIGYAIQDVGLLPHRSIAQNIGIVPEIEGWPKAKVQQRVAELLELVGLGAGLGARYPHQLSGGQRQRVGVARALAADPAILLMDEPFGALDPLTRADLQREFLSLQRELKKTVVFVTHDLHEALFLGSRIALLEEGRLVACRSREEFLTAPDSLIRKYVEAFGMKDIASKRGSE